MSDNDTIALSKPSVGSTLQFLPRCRDTFIEGYGNRFENLRGPQIHSKKASSHSEYQGPKCQWDGCEKSGTHRAPVGRDAEGLYLLFCLEHVSDYNKGYNYATDLSNPNVARYQKEATTGKRQTWGTVVGEPTEAPMPSTARSGSAKALNARKTASQRQANLHTPQMRKLKALEARAFETLGLSPGATPQEIRSRYKEKLKMHHPDANDGSRASEEALSASIEAHKILKLNVSIRAVTRHEHARVRQIGL